MSAAILFGMAGCSTTSQAPAAAEQKAAKMPAPSQPGVRVVKSRDGSYTGEIVGTPAADSKFAKLQIGMGTVEVQKIVGRFPDELHNYESGKRWIPFYFGNDARRTQMLYKGEGCLIFTAGGVFGAGDGDLLQIEADPSGACYKP